MPRSSAKDADDRLDPPGRAEEVPGHGFRGADRDLVGILPEDGLDGNGLELVTILGRRAMGVDIAHFRG